jgi:hypothetical protein
METLLLQSDLKDLIHYCQDTGVFKWKKSRRGIKTNVALGCDNGFGYLRITVLGKSYYAHRLAWFYVHGVWADEIDHINGIKSDNRICNLRNVNRQENATNKHGAQKNSKTKVLGVSPHKRSGKWQAHICVAKQRKYLGLFDDINEAHKAYLIEKERYENERS